MGTILHARTQLANGTLVSVQLTDFWERMNSALGPGYAPSWARDHVIGSLQGQTVEQALAAGEDAKLVWRAVHSELELPLSAR